MNLQTINWKWIGVGAGVLIVLALGVWIIFFRGSSTQPNGTTQGSEFGSSGSVSPAQTTPGADTNVNQPSGTSQTAVQKIFKVAAPPVAGAVLIQTFHPTTTLARYVTADSGHVLDMVLDSPGQAPRTTSGTTIPGIQHAEWFANGEGVILQYLDQNTIKSVYLALSPATTTATASVPLRIQFLPDNILDLAASPDGKSVAYLLKSSSGADGFTAKPDGSTSKKIFSSPLSQVLLSWPSQNTLLLSTRSSAGVPGAVFSVDAKTGALSSLVFAPGVSAIADRTFTHIIYQQTNADGAGRSTYSHDIKANTNRGLSFDPLPEQCAWSKISTTTLYCATPLTYVPPNFNDLWHMGLASAADSILSFNILSGSTVVLAKPGDTDGGVQSDVAEVAVSPDDHYLTFITKGDRTLWGVRLGQ